MAPPAFDAARFQRALQTTAIGRCFIYRPVVETTMTLARREADEGASHGTMVFAEEQTAGRGRKGRSFYSPSGQNLYFTLVLRLDTGAFRSLPMAVPLAVCRAIAAEGVNARIKWPNDIWIGGRKTCGMLIDGEVAGERAVAFPGIGINVNGDPTVNPELRDIATSIAREVGRHIPREDLLARVCNELEVCLALTATALAAAYRARSLVLGRAIIVSSVEGTFNAVALEVEPDGGLRVRCEDSEERVLNAAEVSLRPAP